LSCFLAACPYDSTAFSMPIYVLKDDRCLQSIATQGHISRPGSWSFPDCMEVGVPGGGSLTWEESKSEVALFAVASAPLILGNDARKGRMQQRLVDLLTNPTMIRVNQQYSAAAAFAGGRINTSAPAKELWAKPLPNNTVAVVLLNRGGTAIGVLPPGQELPPMCHKAGGKQCVGCNLPGDQPWLAPCDDNATASSGAQTLAFSTAQVPRAWLVGGADEGQRAEGAAVSDDPPLSCTFFDIFPDDSPHKGKALAGKMAAYSAMVPPHGVKFLLLSNCA
jgi:hypothetical protein